ncbi:YitT family protein [Alteromonas sp. 5E99-2]|uniref:YitT family protein n=1 Tax=Alteromonas sp. 5E99-2 TaxID=2817683 RepID=UPI001A996AEE|nr:YitT family protein [Alteromonas sp. 5E99-2]MBO1254732.1 YitT family protein [Alteromonas sp. 5E99-2]
MSNGIIRLNHKWFEDVMALVIGTSFVSFGLFFLKHVGMVTGGTAGLSLYINYQFDTNFGLTYFIVNLPFYYLAIRRMGIEFTLKTFCSVILVSVFSNLHGHFITLNYLNPVYGAIMGSFFFGIGLLVIFRHKASLGGVNILALYLQEKTGIRAGWLMMGVDISIILISATIVSPLALILSVICVVLLSSIIALNHRKDRYLV